MNLILNRVGTISATLYVIIGCADHEQASANVAVPDGGADAAQQIDAKDAGRSVLRDASRADAAPPTGTIACYVVDQPNPEEEAQGVTAAIDKLMLAYHDALPAVPGACSAADIAIVQANLTPTGFLRNGYNFLEALPTLPVSQSCLSCALAEFKPSERGSSDEERKASRWGPSAFFLNAQDLDLPSGTNISGNIYGCAVRRRYITDAEAAAASALASCDLYACGTKWDTDLTCEEGHPSGKYARCVHYARTIGACKTLAAEGEPAELKLMGNPYALAACNNVAGTLAAFCGPVNTEEP